MTPREQIAPIGSEVVLIASYLGNGDRLITNEKIEWSLEGVGTIEKFDAGYCCDIFLFDYVKAKKVSERYAITKTSSRYQTIDRGTPDTSDDIHLLRGQTWITVNSMKEGTTHVTAFAPNMADWTKRTDAGIVHWVDAQWVLPRLHIAPVGKPRVLTTTLLRATNGQPRKGWIVRYEILNGPAAGLGASGAQIEEVETDWSGQAITTLTPRDQQAGTNTIGIQIIRPAGMDGSDRRITVGSEMVRQTWSGSPNVFLNVSGPAQASPGQELPYTITAENRSSSPMQGVIALPIPPMASYIQSSPAGVQQGSTVLWNVILQPSTITSINVVLRQGPAGSLWVKPEFHPTSGFVTAAPSTPIPTPSPPVSPPGQSGDRATLFPGAPPTQPPVVPSPPPTVFPSVRSPIAVQIEPDLSYPIVQGQPFMFYVRVTNTGTTEVRNIRVRIPLPPEFDSRSVKATSEPLTVDGRPPTPPPPADAENLSIGVTRDHQFGFRLPSLAAGTTAYALLEFPTIDQQGHNIEYTVYVEGQPAGQGSKRIVP
jgi:uncharacterized repeat protein (TIGR01451 family)